MQTPLESKVWDFIDRNEQLQNPGESELAEARVLALCKRDDFACIHEDIKGVKRSSSDPHPMVSWIKSQFVGSVTSQKLSGRTQSNDLQFNDSHFFY